MGPVFLPLEFAKALFGDNGLPLDAIVVRNIVILQDINYKTYLWKGVKSEARYEVVEVTSDGMDIRICQIDGSDVGKIHTVPLEMFLQKYEPVAMNR
jgi:hypothetical protein